MAKNVKFIRTTKEKWLKRDTYDPYALYFCEDTHEMCKGDKVLTDGMRVVPTRADLPDCPHAADGVIYYVADTKSGFMMSPDRTEWIQTIYAPIADANTIPEDEIYNTVTTVGAVRDIEAKIYERIEEKFNSISSSGLEPVDGTIVITNAEDRTSTIGVGISATGNNILQIKNDGLYADIKVSDNAHGLVAVDGTLTLNLATTTSDGAMSKEDKKFIDAIPSVYVARKYEISDKPIGTLVDYRDKEIRIMCPTDTEWALQNSGDGADANTYYIGFKAYAPESAVSFKEDLKETIEDDTMYYFEGNEFAGTDKYGRHYSVVWLPVANYVNGTWNYYGDVSTENKYIGWHYTVEWYDANGIVIESDSIRINLSNENCHYNIKPYYMNTVITSDEAESIKETVAAMEESYSWGEMF